MKKIIVIAGATAGGKSNLALALAHKYGGEIVNADSVQVYEDIPLLTARPLKEDMEGIPHYLYGYLSCYQTGTLVEWLKQAAPVINEVPYPIVVGGTGMYIDALINGVNEIPDIPQEVREQVRKMELAQVIARVRECPFVDPQRLRRALEVQLATGKPLAWFQSRPRKRYVEADFVKIWLQPPRPVLYERCERRFTNMIEGGALEQVGALLEKNPTGGVTKAIGYEPLSAYLKGELSLQAAIAASTQATRNYAKRQTTWFKNKLNADYVLSDSSQDIDI